MMSMQSSFTTTKQPGYRINRTRASSSRANGVYKPSPADFINSFYAVLRRWKSETAFESNPEKIVSHPSFEALVNNAETIAPLILYELKKQPSHLVWALEEAFHERPYAEADQGNIRAMSEAWVAWGETNGVVA